MNTTMPKGVPELVTLAQPNSPAAEAYRVLRTNLQYAAVDRPLGTILFTSAGPDDGKATTVANLAVSFAQMGKRVILVDADLRQPALHLSFGAHLSPGLSSLLVATAEAESRPDALPLQPTGQPNLRLLAAGPVPPNPAELLASSRLDSVLAALAAEADLVLIDSPPVTAVTDAAVIAPRTDGTVLLIAAGQVRRDGARRAKVQLQAVRAKLLGVVLTNVTGDSAAPVEHYPPQAAVDR